MNEIPSWIVRPTQNKNEPALMDFDLPKEEMKAAGWQEGDPLSWRENDDGTWTVALKFIR